jgi:hypothetical protein
MSLGQKMKENKKWRVEAFNPPPILLEIVECGAGIVGL